ncbi:MAG TPA: peptidase M61 [Sphingomicrobium sp.]|nr:peptidase M61 [Sphingomicrobium sp.]
MRELALPALLALTGAAAAPPYTAPAPSLSVSLKPGTAANSRDIDHLDVTLRMENASTAGGAPVLQIPLIINNVVTSAERIGDLEASDSKGPLHLVPREQGGSADGPRQWSADRPVEGALQVHYRVPTSTPPAPRGAAPPLELTSESGGFSGAGSTFLLLPPGDATYRLSVNWDLSDLPAGAAGASSLGVGNATSSSPLPAEALADSFFMAGTIGRFPDKGTADGFFSAWQGSPPFDVKPLMEWGAHLRGDYIRFFKDSSPEPYGVFIRRNLVNPGGGVALHHSFVTTYGEKTGSDPHDLELTLAHEMFHTFAPRIGDPAGLESSWFGEGLATYYQRELPFRFGMIDSATFLEDLNYTAGRYYTNALGNAPNSEVPKRFWEDTRIRTLPYDRGALYFATVDDAVRKASGGKHSLDDLVLAMRARQLAGKTLTNADWEELVGKELGAKGVADFRAMLEGATPLPASDAFGPCFRRITKPLRRYQLGFDPKVLVEPKRIVRGLIAGSAAAKAGLRDGDEILKPVGQDHIQGDQTGILTLQIRRGDREMTIRYLPRGETVDAWQWARVPGVPDTACARN